MYKATKVTKKSTLKKVTTKYERQIVNSSAIQKITKMYLPCYKQHTQKMKKSHINIAKIVPDALKW